MRIFWGLMAAAVAAVVVRHGADARSVLVCVVYAAGWVLLWLALTRDHGAVELRRFASTTAGRIAAAATLLVLFKVATAISVTAMLQLLMSVSVGLFAFWAIQPRAVAMAHTVGRLLLLAGTLALCLVAVEFVFRLPPVFARTGGGVPGSHRWQRENFDDLAKRSIMAFRSLHTDHRKAKGTVRILALGDSFTWGIGIGHTEDLWPNVLEREVNSSAHPIEVINAGVPTYTTVNEAEVLATKGWAFEPDVVVLEFTLNDPMPSGPHFVRANDTTYFGTTDLSPLMHLTLERYSFFYSYLDWRYKALQITRQHPRGLAPLFDDDFDGWQACKAAIREMADASRQRHVPMMLMLFPYFVSGGLDDASYPYLEAHRKVMAAAEEAGIPAMDLRPLFARINRDGPSWWARPYDAHPNVEGHHLAGEALAAKLRDLNWLPASAAESR